MSIKFTSKTKYFLKLVLPFVLLFQWTMPILEKEKNIHIKVGKSKEEFVKMRDERDKKLNMPKLIIPSLQVNMRAGNMPDPDEQGNTYIKVPVNKL